MQTKEGEGAMKPYEVFASRFGCRVGFNSELVVEKAQRYYLLNPRLKKMLLGDYYYAGLYLGKIKKGIFFPSFNLLDMLVDAAANKIRVDQKAAWLFICGRDVFRQGMVKVMGSRRKGDFTLVLNEFGECLGFGMILDDLGRSTDRVLVRNVLDVGDFLRRERRGRP
jgi:ribosome biogenesis protein Nip4